MHTFKVGRSLYNYPYDKGDEPYERVVAENKQRDRVRMLWAFYEHFLHESGMNVCSASFRLAVGTLHSSMHLPPEPDLEHIDSAIHFNQTVGVPYKHPVWVMDEVVTRALSETDLPFDTLEHYLKPPFPSMLLTFPRSLPVGISRRLGVPFALECVFLTEDIDWRRKDGRRISVVDQIWNVERETMVDRVGGAELVPHRGLLLTDMRRFLDPNGAFRGRSSFRVCVGDSIRPSTEADERLLLARREYHFANIVPDDMAQAEHAFRLADRYDPITIDVGDNGYLVRVVLNFLMTLHAGYLDPRTSGIPSGDKSTLSRLGFKGPRDTRTYVRLGRRAEDARREARRTGERGTARAALVRGHWHSYWRLDPGKEAVFDRRTREDGKVLFRVRYWIPPYQRGEGDVSGPRYRSTTRDRSLPPADPFPIEREVATTQSGREVEASWARPQHVASRRGTRNRHSKVSLQDLMDSVRRGR